MLKDKTVLLGVTGSIAAYKIAYACQCAEKASCGRTCAYDEKCG